MDYKAIKNLMRSYLGDIVDTQELEYLFVNDLNTSYKCSPYINSKGFTHLHKCVMLTNKYPNLNNYLEEYFKKYDNVNQVNNELWSALHLASCNSRTASTERTVEILINANADVNLQNNEGKFALYLASWYSGTESTERTVEILINSNANINLQDNQHWSALHVASSYSETYSTTFNNIEGCATGTKSASSTERTVEILINAGVNVNLQDIFGQSALHYASEFSGIISTERTVEILINANVDVNLQSICGWTALHLASGTERTAEILIKAGADVFNLKNDRNNTPYDCFSKELKEYLQIDEATQTIGIFQGRLTECAKK